MMKSFQTSKRWYFLSFRFFLLSKWCTLTIQTLVLAARTMINVLGDDSLCIMKLMEKRTPGEPRGHFTRSAIPWILFLTLVETSPISYLKLDQVFLKPSWTHQEFNWNSFESEYKMIHNISVTWVELFFNSKNFNRKNLHQWIKMGVIYMTGIWKGQ